MDKEKYFELEKQMHEQFATKEGNNFGQLVSIIIALFGIIAVYGYVYVYSACCQCCKNKLLLCVGEDTVIYRIEVLVYCSYLCMAALYLIYEFTLNFAFYHRNEQFIVYAIRKKYESIIDSEKIFPSHWIPFGKTMFDAVPEVYKIVLISVIILFYAISFVTLGRIGMCYGSHSVIIVLLCIVVGFVMWLRWFSHYQKYKKLEKEYII